MLVLVGLLMALQGAPVPADTADSTPVRRPLIATPEQLASAYEDSAARTLVALARRARLSQDSSLIAYDAVAKRRLTVQFGFGDHAWQRLLLRSEGASRVRWRRGIGAHIDVLAARTAIPLAYPGARVLSDMLDDEPVPYFPGREGLIGFNDLVTSHDRHGSPMIHPLEENAEARYRYASGDSISFAFPDGRRVRLRELRVIPRAPAFELIVGSLWIDAQTGQIVRAVYRPAAAMDIAKVALEDDPHSFDDVPGWVKPMIFPMSATVTAFIVEYGLVDERWWMPRIQTFEGRARMGPTRATFSLAQTFRYASVNARDSLPPIVIADMSDSARRARGDTIRVRGLSCATGDTVVRRHMEHEGTLPVEVRIPCDTAALAHSPELPPSIFDAGEQLFGVADRNQVLSSLGLSVQPGFHVGPPALTYGLTNGLTRYNRVEGLSVGARLDEDLGAGYTADVIARIGVADWQPGVELQGFRSDGVRTIGLGVYRRLVPVGDRGNPFSLGSSLGALVLGSDDAFYFRTWGVELTGEHHGAATFTWRAFAEEQRNADANTSFSLDRAFGSRDLRPNIRAARAGEAGAVLGLERDFGLDPAGWRLGLGAHVEGATGTFDYARASLDASVSRGLGHHLESSLALSGGSSVGTVPPQRLWYLGGAQTVRGQIAGQDAGDAYWFGRASIAYGLVAVRPSVFFDMGWAGPRAELGSPGTPISGAGVGVSFLDGLLHFDVARGIQPTRSWRGALYVSSTF